MTEGHLVTDVSLWFKFNHFDQQLMLHVGYTVALYRAILNECFTAVS